MVGPRHAMLDNRLRALVDACGAVCAFVVDSSGEAYGMSQPLPDGWRAVADPAVALVAEEASASALTRGGRVRVVRADAAPFVIVESFAGVYLVMLVFEGAFEGTFVTRRLRRVLPDIEALTVALPPRDPNREAGVRRVALR